ncbi:uncharacterized protein V1513DRAFT_461276 [Lipomyces chichibuensis]|uniref:uncharacterized protein n=1 Tax=Lipomyces chichibuensis TaxID=1546026 RepID=UPI00334369FC
MDTVVAGSSTNFRRSFSRARSHGPQEFSRSPTDVSSTTSVTVSTNMCPQKLEKGGLSDYDTALNLLKDNPPEQRLDFHLPYSQYLKLEECWSKIRLARDISEDQKYPYLAYNSAAEIVTVVTVPRALHERPAVELTAMILDSAKKYLYSHGADASLVRSIGNAGSTTYKGVYGSYSKSKKQADGTITYDPLDSLSTVMIAIEVGYTEDYAHLCRNKDVWIDGRHVKVCILVCLDESPRFRNPHTRIGNASDVHSELDLMSHSVAASMTNDSSQGYYGYIQYRGHKWIGDLTDAFIEVWRANKKQPMRYQLLQNTWSCNRLPKTIGLKVSDFIPDDDWKAANILDGTLSFDADLYLDIFTRSMKATAEERYREFIAP